MASPINRQSPRADRGAAPGAQTAAARGGFRFSARETAVLLVAVAIAFGGTAAAALSPDRGTASAAPAGAVEPTSSATTAHVCPKQPATQTASVAAAPSASSDATKAVTTVAARKKQVARTQRSTTAAVKKTTSTAAKKSTAASSAVTSDKPPALVTVGTLVTYGSWEGAPLKWRVVDADDSSVVLLSQYVLTAGAFQSDWEGKVANSFGGSEVRSWLRNDFGTKAFSAEESAALLPHVGGAAGSERVFLLSADEVKRYLPKASARKAAPHAAAGSGSLGYSSSALTLAGPYAAWWLADAASGDAFTARVVRADGKLGSELVYYPDLGVRPAVRVDASKIVYSLDPQGGN